MLLRMEKRGDMDCTQPGCNFETTRNILVPRVLSSIEKNLSEEIVGCCES